MKRIALALCLLALGTTPLISGSGSADESLIDQLSWMSGRWVIEGENEYVEETWSPAREDAMVGCLRWARKDGVWLYELMSIEEEEEAGLVFRLRHFNRKLEPWKSEAQGPITFPLKTMTENRIVFENPEQDQPRRFVYVREGNHLTIRQENPEGEDEHPFRFRLDG